MMKKIALIIFTLMTIIGCTACGQTQRDLGDVMKKAAMNTVMGMGTVFLVLILISIIIYFLGFIGKAGNKNKTVKMPEKAPEKEIAVEAAAAVPEDLTDDFELVAVIAAAIAASEGVPADSLIVRSIRRKTSSNQWKNV